MAEPTTPARAEPRTRWQELDSLRSGVLARARAAAALTIPALLPDVGTDENSELVQPYQSLGARGINNLASKMLLALFPTTTSFFRLTADEDVLEKAGAAKTDIEDALRRRENKVMRQMERGNLRTTLFGALKSLIAVGNTLLYLPQKAPSRTFRLDQYVVGRDPDGVVIETYIKECADPRTLKPEVRLACDVKLEDGAPAGSKAKTVDIYTAVVRRTDGSGMVDWWQEINDKEVPGSRGQSKAEECPYIVLRWSALDGENYGRGHVEEYIGDLRSLEGLSMAIVSFSAVAAKVIFLVHPNSSTSVDDLMIAQTGDFVTGALKDIEALQLDKYADFKVSQAVLQDLVLRLSHAFLLQSGTVRDAERVTAEEIRQQAQELEDVLGGVYTVQSQELQLPLVRRVIALMERAKELPKLPPEAKVEPTIVTGFDALDRGHELQRIKAFLSDASQTLGPQVLIAYLKVSPLLKQFALAYNVDIEDIVKTDEEVKAEQQQQQMMATASEAAANAAGPAAGAAVKGYADSVNQ